ncbi:MAG: tRNA pseudouridine(38-40) synthase TruA [Pedobacter sp.]|nr:tRNA pseudouridine(38-40) synthase TruA [Chitinophagaceae bacterium]
MARYFIEVAYKGTKYSGFQVQQNAVTIQSKVEEAMLVFYKQNFQLTCSSRTDAGVHALQNFYHTDCDIILLQANVYNLNALLPPDIIIKNIIAVSDDLHARFSGESREYKYYISQQKNPFLTELAWRYQFVLNIDIMQTCAAVLMEYKDFTSFSKKHTQVNNFNCNIVLSHWIFENDCLVYNVKANRFLRGMVRGLVGTMLLAGRGVISVDGFRKIVEAKDCTKANFSTPAHGLFLKEVAYPENAFITLTKDS